MKVAFLDFDHTLCDANSDTWIFDQFDKGLIRRIIDSHPKDDWTTVMNAGLKDLWSQGVTASDVIHRFKAFPMSPFIKTFLELLKEQNFYICIVSDANDLYIESCLEAFNIRHYIDEIWTNGVVLNKELDTFEINYLFGSEKYPFKHTCKACGPSMCKSDLCKFLLQRFRKSQEVSVAIYCGDGHNDLCGILGCESVKNFTAFVRRGFSLERLVNKIPKSIPFTFWDDINDLCIYIQNRKNPHETISDQ